MLSRNHDNQETRNCNHGNSNLVYTVDGGVQYEYASDYNVTQNMQVGDRKCHIVEVIEEQIPYSFVTDTNTYENREIASERENIPMQRQDMVDKVEAVNKNPVCDIEISKWGNKKGPIESSKQDSQFSRNPNAGTTIRMNLEEVDLQSVRQQLRSTKSLVLKPSNSATNSGNGKENMGFVHDTDDLYEEVSQPHEYFSKQRQHPPAPLPGLPSSDKNQPAPQVKATTPEIKQIIYDNTVDDSHVQSFVPVGAHHGMSTGSCKDVLRLPVDIREFEGNDGNNTDDSEHVYGNATLADLAISMNEAVENRRKPRRLTQNRRKTGAETSDSDRSWWTDDEWSA